MIGEWMHAMDESGLTPLDRAFRSNHLEVAELMLRMDKENREGATDCWTPLHRAAMLGLSAAVRSLVQYGSDPATRDEQGETPLHKAAREGHVETVAILADVTDVNLVNNLGMAPLHWAALAGRTDVARVLLDHGADPAMHNEVLDGLSPALLADVMGYEELASYLVSRTSFAA